MTDKTPTSVLLEQLNSMRADRDQLPLKSWKGSRAALEETITAYKTHKVAPAVAEGAYPTATQAEASTGINGTHEKKREAIRKANVPADETSTKESAMPAKSKKTNKPTKSTKPASDLVSLADIARELKIEPKLARAKARRSDEITKLAQGDSWAFKPADAATVKKILKG